MILKTFQRENWQEFQLEHYNLSTLEQKDFIFLETLKFYVITQTRTMILFTVNLNSKLKKALCMFSSLEWAENRLVEFVTQVQLTKKAIGGKRRKRPKESSENKPVLKKIKKHQRIRKPLNEIN